MYIGLPKSTRNSCLVLMTLEIFRKILEYQVTILMKIHPVGVELFHTDGGTDGGAKLILTLRNFVNTPKNIFSGIVFYHLKHAKFFKVFLKAVSS